MGDLLFDLQSDLWVDLPGGLLSDSLAVVGWSYGLQPRCNLLVRIISQTVCCLEPHAGKQKRAGSNEGSLSQSSHWCSRTRPLAAQVCYIRRLCNKSASLDMCGLARLCIVADGLLRPPPREAESSPLP